MIQDYGFRLYNPAIAKFLSVDPLAPEYPELTCYQFASNMPINSIDRDGLESEIVISKTYSSIPEPIPVAESVFTIQIPKALQFFGKGTLKINHHTIYEGKVSGEGVGKTVEIETVNGVSTSRQLEIETISYNDENGNVIWEFEDYEENEYQYSRYEYFELPWYADFGGGRNVAKSLWGLFKVSKNGVKPFKTMREVLKSQDEAAKTLKLIGGRPNAINKKVWEKLSKIEQKKFTKALQKGVTGAEGSTSTGILRLENKKWLDLGYTHKIKIGNSNNRLYGKQVDGKWVFDRIATHD